MSFIKPALIFYCLGAYLVGMLLGTSGLVPNAPARSWQQQHGQAQQVQVASNHLAAATSRRLP